MEAACEASLQQRLRSPLCLQLPDTALIRLLQDAANDLDAQIDFIRAMDHAIQSTWKCLTEETQRRFANDNSISIADRLPCAVLWQLRHELWQLRQ